VGEYCRIVHQFSAKGPSTTVTTPTPILLASTLHGSDTCDLYVHHLFPSPPSSCIQPPKPHHLCCFGKQRRPKLHAPPSASLFTTRTRIHQTGTDRRGGSNVGVYVWHERIKRVCRFSATLHRCIVWDEHDHDDIAQRQYETTFSRQSHAIDTTTPFS
jgi:hypothetical protein